jgi:hypothetical protein
MNNDFHIKYTFCTIFPQKFSTNAGRALSLGMIVLLPVYRPKETIFFDVNPEYTKTSAYQIYIIFECAIIARTFLLLCTTPSLLSKLYKRSHKELDKGEIIPYSYTLLTMNFFSFSVYTLFAIVPSTKPITISRTRKHNFFYFIPNTP